MDPLTNHAARDWVAGRRRLSPRAAHVGAAIAIEVALALMHLPSAWHAGLAVSLHLVAEMIR